MSLLRVVLRQNAFVVSSSSLSSHSRLARQVQRCHFHSHRPVHSENVLTAQACKAWSTLQKASTHELFAYTNKSLAILAPAAVVLSPSFINAPVDLALGVIVPLHMYIGCTGVIQDYIPENQQGLSITLLGILSLLTGLGLLKINLCGVGITESVKSLWREPKSE